MLEAIDMTEKTVGRKLDWTYVDEARIGDHKGWISDLAKFQAHYPDWRVQHNVPAIIAEITDALRPVH
jgi:CDP-paratose 2-epimerase